MRPTSPRWPPPTVWAPRSSRSARGVHGGAGRLPARSAGADRGAVGGAVPGPRGASEVGAFGYPCDAGGGMHLNEDEFFCELLDPHGDGRGRRRRAGRAGDHRAGAHRLPRHPLPHGRRRRGVRRALPGGARGALAAQGHPRALRRHGRDPRDERVPLGHRADPARVARGRRVPDHLLQRPDRHGRGQGRGRALHRRARAGHPGEPAPASRAAGADRPGHGRASSPLTPTRPAASRTCAPAVRATGPRAGR